MKVFVFILLLSFISLFSQEPLFKDGSYVTSAGAKQNFTLSGSTALITATGSYWTKSFDIGGHDATTTGIWGIVVSLDSIAHTGATADDTLYIFPEYWLGTTIGWVLGDTLQLHRRDDTEGRTAHIDTQTRLSDVAQHGIKYYWQSKPSNEYSIHSFPYQRVKLKVVVSDLSTASVGFNGEFFKDTYYKD